MSFEQKTYIYQSLLFVLAPKAGCLSEIPHLLLMILTQVMNHDLAGYIPDTSEESRSSLVLNGCGKTVVLSPIRIKLSFSDASSTL